MRLSVQLALKYGLDRPVAAILLVACLPLMALIAICVKLEDGGPVLFGQTRPGLDRRPFRVLKFRTMIPDADHRLDPRGRPAGNRVTRVGRILRRTSLDELAQLLNIVRGEMSIVGPRPVLMSHLERYTDRQLQRFRMKPGVTGLAQIKGRNLLKWSRRIRYDNWYIDHYSPCLDLGILLRTVPAVLASRGVVLDRNPDDVDDLGPPGDRAVSVESER